MVDHKTGKNETDYGYELFILHSIFYYVLTLIRRFLIFLLRYYFFLYKKKTNTLIYNYIKVIFLTLECN